MLGEVCPRVVPTEPPPRGHRSASRPTAHFHSERHAASRLYEMEPHNQIEKPQCRTVQMKETLQLNPTSPPTTTKSNRNSPALEQLCSTSGSYLHTSGIIRGGGGVTHKRVFCCVVSTTPSSDDLGTGVPSPIASLSLMCFFFFEILIKRIAKWLRFQLTEVFLTHDGRCSKSKQMIGYGHP